MGVETRIFPRLDVAVLCGGPGPERQVSLQSGEQIAAGLSEAGWGVRKIVIDGRPEEIDDLDCQIAFIALHGEFGEDGQLQRLLEDRGIAYTGSGPETSALAMNKDRAKKAFVHAGLPTPWWTLVTAPEQSVDAVESMGFSLPVVVKPVNRGSSVGTSIVRHQTDLNPAVVKALTVDTEVMIEEFVEGRELTASMLAGVALPLVEMTPKGEFYDYNAKYHDEDTGYLCPAPFGAEQTCDIQTLAMRTIEVLGVEHFGRIDIIMGPDGPMVLEANTIPGFTEHSLLPLAARSAGITFPLLVTRIVKLALDRAGMLQKLDSNADNDKGATLR